MLVQDLLEHVVIQVQDHVRIHLDEPSIGIEGETSVAGQLGQAFHRLVVEAEVQDRVHHARHRGAGARSNGDQQGIARFAEPLASQLFHARQSRRHLTLQVVGIASLIGVEVRAALGGDREPRRHRQAQGAHLRQVGALAAQQVLHRGVAVGGAAAKGVNPASLGQRIGGHAAFTPSQARNPPPGPWPRGPASKVSSDCHVRPGLAN